LTIATMSPSTRKKLVQMACIAAWSDLEIHDSERRVIFDLATQLALPGNDLADVREWLQSPPPDFDPYEIPNEHRAAFLAAFLEVVTADGRIDPEESETIRLLRELVV
jgi:uncharacterized tellurite resistance protein B-like protein